MVRQTSTNYMSQEQRDRLESAQYTLAMYRNPENIEADYVLRDFLSFLEHDKDISKRTKGIVDGWITEYLGYTIQQVQEAEKAMLNRWINDTV